MYEKLKRKNINPNLQSVMPSPQQQQQQQLPTSAPPPGSGPTRLYQANNYARPPRPPHSNAGPPDEDLMSRLGKASNITTGRSLFVPPQSPAAQSYHSRLRHDHHRPSRIPSPSIAPDNSLFSYRHHHPPRRESMDRTSPMASHQHEQQLLPYQHKHHRKGSPTSQYYHKFVDKSRHK